MLCCFISRPARFRFGGLTSSTASQVLQVFHGLHDTINEYENDLKQNGFSLESPEVLAARQIQAAASSAGSSSNGNKSTRESTGGGGGSSFQNLRFIQ